MYICPVKYCPDGREQEDVKYSRLEFFNSKQEMLDWAFENINKYSIIDVYCTPNPRRKEAYERVGYFTYSREIDYDKPPGFPILSYTSYYSGKYCIIDNGHGIKGWEKK